MLNNYTYFRRGRLHYKVGEDLTQVDFAALCSPWAREDDIRCSMQVTFSRLSIHIDNLSLSLWGETPFVAIYSSGLSDVPHTYY